MGSALGESGDDSSPFTGLPLPEGSEGSPGSGSAVVGRSGAGTASIHPGDQGPGDQGPADGVGGAGDGSATGEPAICEGKYDLGISGVS